MSLYLQTLFPAESVTPPGEDSVCAAAFTTEAPQGPLSVSCAPAGQSADFSSDFPAANLTAFVLGVRSEIACSIFFLIFDNRCILFSSSLKSAEFSMDLFTLCREMCLNVCQNIDVSIFKTYVRNSTRGVS